jgi:tetratricopeptide (TPR) repeat protein
LFLPVPWLASYGWRIDFTTSVFIVAAIVNLHHFMIDGVVWKLRNPRVGRVLGTSAEASATPAPAPAAAPARPRLGGAWKMAVLAAVVGLAALDQWRYVLAIGHGARDRLLAAARLNPYDSGTYVRLAQAESAAGNPAAAAEALQRAVDANPQNPALARALVRRLIEARRFEEAYARSEALLARWPAQVDDLVNAGVLAWTLDRGADAERWWRQAVERDPSQRRVHLYLAERLDGRGATREALPYYQRYLALAAQSAGADRPAPVEVVGAVVKFADALAKDGQHDTARTQFALAERMAAQTGQRDLAALAQQRRAALDTAR